MSVTFIDKTDLQNPEKRENYWIHTLKTMVPWGLNILNSVWTTRIRTLFSFCGILGHGRFKDKIYGHNILLFRICVYVYIYIYMCMYVCVCAYIYMYIYMCVYVYICMYICIYVYVCIYVCVCMCMCMFYYLFIYSLFTH